MGPNRCLPCLGARADLGGNVGGSALFDRAHSVAELFFELAIRAEFEAKDYYVHVEYGFAGNLTGHWRPDARIIFAGSDPIVEEIHEAVAYDDNSSGNPMIGKADFLLIPIDGRRRCGVIEVGTRRGRGAKLSQVANRVARLRASMTRAQVKGKCQGVEWQAEPWRPHWPPGMRASDPFGPEGHYICAEPTWSAPGGGAPPGLLLYEVHAVLKDRHGARLPVAPVSLRPLASELSRWLNDHHGLATLENGPMALGRAAVADRPLRAEMRRQLVIHGVSALVGGAAALLLAEMPGFNVAVAAAVYQFVEAAAKAATDPRA